MGRLTLVSLVGAAHRKEILETGPRGSRRPAVLSLLESNGEAGNDTGERVTYPHSEIRLVYAALFSRPRIGVAGWIKSLARPAELARTLRSDSRHTWNLYPPGAAKVISRRRLDRLSSLGRQSVPQASYTTPLGRLFRAAE